MAFGPQRLIGESNMTDTVTKERTGPGAGGGEGFHGRVLKFAPSLCQLLVL